ncbi:Uncharacterised protein [Weissella viridescens]|uniref:Uncharacterized protein n=1 Tax=Weissella viridescens TaxID=1629 RepID=A0A380P2L6_WEIVI|nr:Uncharacterised protein [Weissella viridescens]
MQTLQQNNTRWHLKDVIFLAIIAISSESFTNYGVICTTPLRRPHSNHLPTTSL